MVAAKALPPFVCKVVKNADIEKEDWWFAEPPDDMEFLGFP